MANRSTISIESFDEYDVVVVVDDLSTWEFIDPSSSDDDVEDLDDSSFSDGIPSDDGVSGSKEEDNDVHEFGSPASDISMQSLLTEFLSEPSVLDHHHVLVDQNQAVDNGNGNQNSVTVREEVVNYDTYDNDYRYDEDDDEDDDGYGYGFDDELVPIMWIDKLGRQRIRKLGKRGCPKMNKAKKLPYHYSRPGCVRGKHGLGVHHLNI